MLVLFPLVLLLLLPVIWCCYLARALGIPQWREGALGMQWFGYDGAEHWELQWLKKHEDGAPYGRGFSQYGITGFARVISRSSGQAICGPYIRAHLCYHNPCQADWKHDTKYGNVPRPSTVNNQEIGGYMSPQRSPRPCLLPQSCTGILWAHRCGQEETTMMLQKEIQSPPPPTTTTTMK